MKKFFLMMMLLTFFSLTACTTTTVDTSVPDGTEEVSISFSWWGTTQRNIATYEAIELFESLHPHYTIVADQSTWGGYQTSLYTKLENGRESDVFQINYNWIYSMYGEQTFLDLTGLGLSLSPWPAGENDPLTVNGKLLGLSLSETGYIFYLNKSIYDAAGAGIPSTWDELVAAGQLIGAHDPEKYALGRLDAQQIAIIMFSWLAQRTGKNVISGDNKLNFTEAELLSAFAFITTLRNNHVLIADLSEDTYADGPTNPQWVTYQNYGGILQWNTAVSEYEIGLPDSAELVMAGLFQQNAGEQLGMYKKVSMALACSRRVADSPAKALAVKTFIEFLTSYEPAVLTLGVDRGVPSNTTAYQTLFDSTDPLFTETLEWQGHDEVQALFDHQVSIGQDLYFHPYYEHDTFREVYEAPIEEFLFAECTALEAVRQIIRNFDTQLALVMAGE